MSNILKDLDDVLASRKMASNLESQNSSHSSHTSYVSKLYQKGDEAICKKIAEEAAETIMASKDLSYINKNNNIENIEAAKQHLIYETADLWFHSLILLHQHGLSSQEVLKELERRAGTSGLVEKANRPDH